MREFGALIREVEAPVTGEFEQIGTQADALERLLDFLLARRGIYDVLRKYRQDGVSDRDRLKSLYWRLMAGSCGPTTSGKNVALAAITDPTFLMNLLQLESANLTDPEFGIAAWKMAESRWPNSN